MNSQQLNDLDRRLSNLLCVGSIAQADFPNARVRVQIGAILTDWLPWLTTRAGADVSWWAPEVGEQVLVLSPSGDLCQGIALPAIYSTAKPQNSTVSTVHRTTYADGAVIEYDRAASKLKATIPGTAELTCTGAITIKGSSITLDGPVSATSTIAAQGNVSTPADVTAGSISLKNHVHGGVTTGGGQTSTPV